MYTDINGITVNQTECSGRVKLTCTMYNNKLQLAVYKMSAIRFRMPVITTVGNIIV